MIAIRCLSRGQGWLVSQFGNPAAGSADHALDRDQPCAKLVRRMKVDTRTAVAAIGPSNAASQGIS